MKELYKNIRKISKNIYNSYYINDFNKLEYLIKDEKEFYENLDDDEIKKTIDYLKALSTKKDIDLYEDYEIVLYNNEEELIIRRIINKLNQICNKKINYNDNSEKEVIELKPNLTLILPNSDMFLSELYCKLIANIDIKYLFFIINNNELEYTKKQNIFINTLFINPYLEDAILNPVINLEELIKNEDDLYNNLWEYIKDIYQEYLEDYCRNNILLNISMMVSEIDLNNESNVVARSIYLRTLFNYLSREKLEEINYNYNEEERTIYNFLGEEYIKKAFKTIEKDKIQIEKIKTR